MVGRASGLECSHLSSICSMAFFRLVFIILKLLTWSTNWIS